MWLANALAPANMEFSKTCGKEKLYWFWLTTGMQWTRALRSYTGGAPTDHTVALLCSTLMPNSPPNLPAAAMQLCLSSGNHPCTLFLSYVVQVWMGLWTTWKGSIVGSLLCFSKLAWHQYHFSLSLFFWRGNKSTWRCQSYRCCMTNHTQKQ